MINGVEWRGWGLGVCMCVCGGWGRGWGGCTRLRQRQREQAVRTQTETTSNGSLMRDGQCGLYLITNQHSFEFSGEGKCEP